MLKFLDYFEVVHLIHFLQASFLSPHYSPRRFDYCLRARFLHSSVAFVLWQVLIVLMDEPRDKWRAINASAAMEQNFSGFKWRADDRPGNRELLLQEIQQLKTMKGKDDPQIM
jgi:hypothetical protein